MTMDCMLDQLRLGPKFGSRNESDLHPQWAMEEAQRIAKIGSYEIDITGHRSSWSRQAAINFGLPEDTAFGRVDWKTILHPEDQARISDHWQECLREKKDWDLEYRIIRPSGEVAIIHGVGRILLDSEGNPSKMIGTLQDVTEKRAQERLLTEQEATLVQSARLSSLGEMASGISHEINNPLTIITARTHLLRRGLENDADTPETRAKAIRECDLILTTAQRIDSIIRGLKAFASDGRRQPFALSSANTIVEETLVLCRQRFRHNNVQLDVELLPEDVRFECRAVQVGQILINLLNNAFDAVTKATVNKDQRWIKVKVTVTDQAIGFRVYDSGDGVPAPIRSKIMQPFFTTKEVGKGTGLGLSISTGIAKDHCGSLYLDSRSGDTCFVLSLPRKQITAAKPAISV